jgi:hypothetical protein
MRTDYNPIWTQDDMYVLVSWWLLSVWFDTRLRTLAAVFEYLVRFVFVSCILHRSQLGRHRWAWWGLNDSAIGVVRRIGCMTHTSDVLAFAERPSTSSHPGVVGGIALSDEWTTSPWRLIDCNKCMHKYITNNTPEHEQSCADYQRTISHVYSSTHDSRVA